MVCSSKKTGVADEGVGDMWENVCQILFRMRMAGKRMSEHPWVTVFGLACEFVLKNEEGKVGTRIYIDVESCGLSVTREM